MSHTAPDGWSAGWPDEHPALPPTGPTSDEAVRQLIGVPPGDSDLPPAVRAANRLIRTSRNAADWARVHALPDGTMPPGLEWPEAVHHGASLLAGRIWRRRGSLSGVEAVGDLGPVYVARYDPDLAWMLGVGSYTRPQIG